MHKQELTSQRSAFSVPEDKVPEWWPHYNNDITL